MKYLKTYEDKILDKILDKISDSGKDSLSPLEKDYLNKFSKGQSTKDVQQEMNKKEYVDEIGPYEAKLVMTNVEDVDNYDEPNYGAHKKWNGTLYIGDHEYEGFIGFKGEDYLYGYFNNDKTDIYTDLEDFHYEIDQFFENAFYSLIGLIGIVENFFLTEGRVEDIEKKYSPIISEYVFNQFKEGDPSANKSYLRWMCDRWSKKKSVTYNFNSNPPVDDYQIEDVIKMINKYHRIKQKIKEKQIDRIESLEDLAKILNQTVIFDSLLSEDKNNVKILYNTNEWIVFIPYTYEISETYGDKSWCTVYNAKEHFDKHFGNFGSLIYFMNKLDNKWNFALEQTSVNHYHLWNTDDEKKIDDADINELQKFISEYLNGKINDDFKSIVEKIPEAKMTEDKYLDFIINKFKEMGIGKIAKQFGAYPIFVTLDKSPKYYDLVVEVREKYLSKNDDVDYVNKFEDNFYEAFDCNENNIHGEGEELLEKYIDWELLMSNLIQEMDEDEYFEYLDQIK